MSEPAFMNLLFGTCCQVSDRSSFVLAYIPLTLQCQNCGQSNVRVQWAWFIRYCLKCVSAMYVPVCTSLWPILLLWLILRMAHRSYSYYDAQTAILQVDHHRVFIDYDGGEDEDEDDQDDEEDEGEPLLKLFGGYLTQQSWVSS